VTGVALKAAAAAGGLALAFGAAFAVGSAVPTVAAGRAEPAHDMTEGTGAMTATTHASHTPQPTAAPGAEALPGLAVSEAGYTLVPSGTTLPAGPRTPFSFVVTGPDGEPVTRYVENHTKDLHLIVVRRDLSGFQHVHPVMTRTGTWSVPLDLAAAGTYRVFADFEPAALGRGITLGTDVAVAGVFDPVALPAPSRTDVVGGLTVRLGGTAQAGRSSDLTFTVRHPDGRPVTSLEPYLGAFGHLVSLRAGDLAYLHTHPADDAAPGSRGGPEIRFMSTFPPAGSYRLYLDFSVDGEVRTAEFTLDVPPGDGTTASAPAHDATIHQH
jgi:hypothetical protein